MKHTKKELIQWQNLPLNIKILMTKERIRNWINEYGEDGVYISFSGGKDSTVLLDLVRQNYPDIPAVFIDTGLEYPEIREFVKKFDNVIWLKPKMNFKQVIQNYGYPFISKEVSNCVEGARKYLKHIDNRSTENTIVTDSKVIPYACYMADLLGIDRRINKNNKEYKKLKNGDIPDKLTNYDVNDNIFNQEKYKFFLEAPFEISSKCCNIMKKAPAHKFEKETGRKPILGVMAEESIMRTQKWLQEGCNAFNVARPNSKPMSFWTERDVLWYIKQRNLPIASVYGNVIVDYKAMGQCDNQLSLIDYGLSDDIPILKTTGCKRTGCMFCGYGCHLEKSPNRFELMKKTHPKQYEYIMKPTSMGGLGYKAIIDWINQHGNMNIKY